MKTQTLHTTSAPAEGYIIPAGPFNIVCVTCTHGLVGCAVFSPDIFQKLERACALVRGVSSVEDLLNAPIFALNAAAEARGLHIGMSGQEAVEALS